MTEMNRRSVLMVGAGSYLPSHVMTNDDLSEFVETDDSWIKQRTGSAKGTLLLREKKHQTWLCMLRSEH